MRLPVMQTTQGSPFKTMFWISLVAGSAQVYAAGIVLASPTEVLHDHNTMLQTPALPRLQVRSAERSLASFNFLGNDRTTYYLCEGDCDEDSDCDKGLRCFQRDGFSSVPGCSGRGIADVDYCFNPNYGKNSNELIFLEDEPGDKLGRCQGDCDSNSDCRGGLICFKANTRKVFGCDGKAPGGVQYCMDPDDLPKKSEDLLNVGYDVGVKIGKCMGHCDDDSDCRGDLECFLTDGKDEVIGCEGRIQAGTNYCYDPLDGMTPEPTEEPTQEPTEEPTKEPTEEPTKEPTEEPTTTTQAMTVQKTERPTSSPTIASITADTMSDSDELINVGEARDIGTIGKCMGHCRIDAHCRGDLECFEVQGATEVPGCEGLRENDDIGYCYDPNDEVIASPQQGAANVPAEPVTSPTASPGELSEELFTAIPTLQPTFGITAQPTAPEVPHIAVSIPPFVIELGFLTPSRRMAAPEQALDRQLLIKENIEEEGELLDVVGSILDEEIRALSPTTYIGVLLRVDFLDETASDGITTIAYEFSGRALFSKDSELTLLAASLVENAVMRAADEEELFYQLRRSGDPVLEAVQFISLPFHGVSKQEDEGSKGIRTGVIALVAVVVTCAVVILGAFIHMRRQKGSVLISSNQSRSFESIDNGGDELGKPRKISKRILSSLPSPTRSTTTRSTVANADSYEHTGDVESAAESSAIPDYPESIVEASSVGGPRSDWSVDGGQLMGYNSSEVSAAEDPSANGGGANILQRRNVNLTDTVIALDKAQAEEAMKDGTQSEAEFSVDTDNMSALGDIRLGSVLQVEDHENDAVANENEDNFREVWKQKQKQEQQRYESSEHTLKLFGISFPSHRVQREGVESGLALSSGADPEEVLKEMVGVIAPSTGPSEEIRSQR